MSEMTDQMAPKRSLFATIVPGVVLAALLVSAVAAIYLNGQALEQRRVEARILEFELATHTVAMIDLIDEVPPAVAVEYDQSVDVIESDVRDAISAVDPADRSRVLAFREDLLEAAEAGEDVPLSSINSLLVELGDARRAALANALEAERTASRALFIAAIAALAAGVVIATGRIRERDLRNTLRKQATTDWLTGLPNRRAIAAGMEDARRTMNERPCHTGLLSMDLDGFKTVNDSFGHPAGDELLNEVADRLRAAKESDETLIRLGGDEFAVLLPCLDDPSDAGRAAERYLEAFAEPCQVGGRSEPIRASIGLTTTDDPDELDGLIAEADIAMYAAKRRGGQRATRFDTSMRSKAESDGELTRALRSADYDQEFSLVYQPVVGVDDGRPLFIEALLRWTSPDLGPVGPGDFIPIAESSGEIGSIGTWVLATAVEQLAKWSSDPGFADARISVNVSALQLFEEGFVDYVLGVLRDNEVAAERLVIEVTESVALGDSGGPFAVLSELRANGIIVAIDDFGAGYANLEQLLRVPFDILKIDRMLMVRLIEHTTDGQNIAQEFMSAISSISSALGATLVCEGVETEEQRQVLERSGVTHIQGWLVGRPAPPEQLVFTTNEDDELPNAA